MRAALAVILLVVAVAAAGCGASHARRDAVNLYFDRVDAAQLPVRNATASISQAISHFSVQHNSSSEVRALMRAHSLFSQVEAGNGEIENSHAPHPDAITIFGDSILYVHTEECTSCTACYQPDVCPVGAIYSEEVVPDGSSKTKYNTEDQHKGHDHTFFIALSRDVFAD